MSNHTTEIGFSNIPVLNIIDDNDKIIIDTPDGIRTVKIKDIVFKNYNTTFGVNVEKNTNNINQIETDFYVKADALNPVTKTKIGAISLFYKSDPRFDKEVVIKNSLNHIIPLNFLGANSMQEEYPSGSSTISEEPGILLLPGTYRIRAAACFCIRNPGRYYSQTGLYAGEPYGCNIYMDLAQIDSPERVMLVSDIKYVPVRALKGKTSVSTSIDGFFYICKTARVALRVTTDGNVSLGDGSIDNNIVPKPPLIDYVHYKNFTYPVQILIERISLQDVHNLLGVSL